MTYRIEIWCKEGETSEGKPIEAVDLGTVNMCTMPRVGEHVILAKNIPALEVLSVIHVAGEPTMGLVMEPDTSGALKQAIEFHKTLKQGWSVNKDTPIQ